MILEGTVVNGAIVLDGGANLPEGARVQVKLPKDSAESHPPTEPYDRDKELTILREALEEVKAGQGMSFEEFMSGLAAEFKLPPVPPG